MSLLHKRTLYKKKAVPPAPAPSVVAFSEKTAEILMAAGHGDANALRRMSDDEILDIKGIGQVRLKEIREVLDE